MKETSDDKHSCYPNKGSEFNQITISGDDPAIEPISQFLFFCREKELDRRYSSFSFSMYYKMTIW